jgi:hypothetical protein
MFDTLLINCYSYAQHIDIHVLVSIHLSSQLSVLEIYNETVYDLLGTDNERVALSIKLNAQGQVHVKGLTRVDVHAMPDVVSEFAIHRFIA